MRLQDDWHYCNPKLPGDHVQQFGYEQYDSPHLDRSMGHPRHIFRGDDNVLLRQIGTQARDCMCHPRTLAGSELTLEQYISYALQITGCLLVVTLWARYEAGGSSNAAMGRGVIGVMYLVCLGFSGPMNAFIAAVCPQFVLYRPTNV